MSDVFGRPGGGGGGGGVDTVARAAVAENAGALVGAAPADAKMGVDTTSGQVYYNDGGTWTPVPGSSVDVNTIIGDTVAGNYGGGAPSNAPGTADTGDVLVEFYDDVVAYFTATGVNTWPAAAQKTVSMGGAVTLATAVSPASDDATGAVGTSSDVARQDHKHPAQGRSTDANNRITIGTDGLHMLADLVGADGTNPGTAGAVPAPAAADNVNFLRGDGTWQPAATTDEVIESAGVLAGAAPAGAQVGVDTTSGQIYYVSGGNWTAVPGASVDLNTTVGDTVAGDYAGGAANNPPATADTGDVLIEFYDDVIAYFTATGVDTWPAAAQKTIPANLNPVALRDFIGFSQTFAGFTNGVQINDYSILQVDEVGTGTATNPQYPKGVYVWTGAAYEFAFPAYGLINPGGDMSASATVYPYSSYTVSGGAVTATLPILDGTAAEPGAIVFFSVHTGGGLTIAADAADTVTGDTTGVPGDIIMVTATGANTWTAKKLGGVGSFLTADTIANLNANNPPAGLPLGTEGRVTQDTVLANNGIYLVVNDGTVNQWAK